MCATLFFKKNLFFLIDRLKSLCFFLLWPLWNWKVIINVVNKKFNNIKSSLSNNEIKSFTIKVLSTMLKILLKIILLISLDISLITSSYSISVKHDLYCRVVLGTPFTRYNTQWNQQSLSNFHVYMNTLPLNSYRVMHPLNFFFVFVWFQKCLKFKFLVICKLPYKIF